MIIIGIVRISVLAGVLSGVYAVPLFARASAGLATYPSGSGPIATITVGAIAGSIALIAGQIAFTTLCSPIIRAAIASSSRRRPPSRDIMPHSASRTSASPLRVGDRQWH